MTISSWLERGVWERLALEETTAHRVCTGEGGWVERLGEDVLISHASDRALEEFLAGLDAWRGSVGWDPQRVFGKFLPRQNADRVAPVLLRGDATLPPMGVVRENGVRYGVDFEAGYSAGLFIDQRRNRLFLRGRRPRRLLNTFAYTGAFSVVAALEGGRTTSLDLSRKSLQRAEENFRLNGLDPAPHAFIADDVLEVLPRLGRRGEKFDAIVLDPPTFSRGAKGRRFQVEQDFEKLLHLALEVADAKAGVLLSTNCTRLERRNLESIARHCLKLVRRQGVFHQEPDLPDIPSSSAARTVWLLLN